MFPSKKFMLSGSLDSGGASVPVAETVEFSDFFDGPVPKYFNGGTWKIVGGRLVNVPIVGDTMLTNGDMENWSNDTTLTGWTNNGVGVVKDQVTFSVNQAKALVPLAQLVK